MKTLKELNETCTLIAEHNQPAFVGANNNEAYNHKDSNRCKLYTDNKGIFYLYEHIISTNIRAYANYEDAIKEYTLFIKNTLY